MMICWWWLWFYVNYYSDTCRLCSMIWFKNFFDFNDKFLCTPELDKMTHVEKKTHLNFEKRRRIKHWMVQFILKKKRSKATKLTTPQSHHPTHSQCLWFFDIPSSFWICLPFLFFAYSPFLFQSQTTQKPFFTLFFPLVSSFFFLCNQNLFI